jgi:hypothetical protein
MSAAQQVNQYEINVGDNLQWWIDASGSMQTSDCIDEITKAKVSRIKYATSHAIQYVKDGSKYDPDGTDVGRFGSSVEVFEKVTADKAESIITKIQAHEGSTRTDLAIRRAWEMHKSGGHKQTVAFFLTDGAPTGLRDGDRDVTQEEVKRIIRGIASELVALASKASTPEEADGIKLSFALSFLTVGIRDETLNAFLTDIDDNLNAELDIVDVTPLNEITSIEQAFGKALHD